MSAIVPYASSHASMLVPTSSQWAQCLGYVVSSGSPVEGGTSLLVSVGWMKRLSTFRTKASRWGLEDVKKPRL